MAKVLRKFKEMTPPEQLKINENLRAAARVPAKPPIDSPRLRKRFEETAQAEAERKRMEELVVKSPLGLELLAIDGGITTQEIEDMPGLDGTFRDKLLKIAKLHEDLEHAQEIAFQLHQELETLKKSVG